MTRYRRDPSWRQPGDGRVVIAGSPLRLFRLSTGGAEVLKLSATGEQPPTPTVQRLLDRLVDAGALHPLPDAGPYTMADVTVVTPAFGEMPVPMEGIRTIVVDDGSEPPLRLPVDAPSTVRLLRLPHNKGPAAARNAGLADVVTPLVAFVDADVDVDPVVDAEVDVDVDGAVTSHEGWLTPLLVHFADPRVALVAPRVMGSPGQGAIAAHEQRHSPLDLGSQPARISPGTRVSYVPAAAFVARTAVLRELGGFDEAMRVGEDVDLVWRLTESGHRCRYEPTSQVWHRPRRKWRDFVDQRVGYGRSAAPLSRRHRGAVAPVRMSGWSAAVWALVVLRRPWLALAVAVATGLALQRKLRDVPPLQSARLVGLGHLAAGRQLATGVTRVWWPAAIVAAIIVPKSRLPLAAAVIGPTLADAIGQRSVMPLRDAPLRWVDQVAYGAGVWRGAIEEKEFGPLMPSFTTWPRRGDG